MKRALLSSPSTWRHWIPEILLPNLQRLGCHSDKNTEKRTRKREAAFSTDRRASTIIPRKRLLRGWRKVRRVYTDKGKARDSRSGSAVRRW